ncbi:MAG: hypothetical protein COA32_16285 [Fluviicola sp.]|nr:MAG: hypothetical protein COA32_16285 [Fluviicola sp.]
MITIHNYYSTIDKINGATLPEILQKGWEFVNKVSNHGKSWEAYHTSEGIKKTVDIYFTKLSEYQNKTEAKSKKATPKKSTQKKVVPSRQKRASSMLKKKSSQPRVKSSSSTKRKAKKPSATELKYQNANKVERLSDELKMIKRFALMHGKIKTQNQIRLFLNALQKAIMEKRIRKTSPHAKEIREIQESLIRLMSKFDRAENIKIEISEEKLSEYLSLVGKHAELRSVKLIKSYINLQGKLIPNQKAKNLYNRIAGAINSDKLTKKDKYYEQVEQVLSSLKSFVAKNPNEGILIAEERTLNGMQNILGECGCKTVSGITTRIPEDKVMNSMDVMNLKFDKLGLKGKWLEFIGNPSKHFKVMIFGRPKFGKSILAVDFAGYLARNHGTVLYVAKEEGIDVELQEKLASVAHPDLYVVESIPEDLSMWDFIFLDSVNKLRLKPQDLEDLRAKYPDKSFISIFQTRKDGLFRGSQEFLHDMDVVIEVPEKGHAVQYGRYNQGGELQIFKNKN